MSSCFYRDDNTGALTVYPGCDIRRTLEEAVTLPVEVAVFEFNGIEFTVRSDSPIELLLRDFHRAMSGYIKGPLGPYAAVELSAADLAADARIEAENEKRRQAANAEYEACQREKQEKLFTLLADTPGLYLRDEEGWAETVQANTDGYGSAVIRYAERWARLMQRELHLGKELEAVAEHTSHLADIEGITGFMHGCAVSILAQAWEYGDRLRHWHNLATQIGDEGERANEAGGVLNPALLSFSTPTPELVAP